MTFVISGWTGRFLAVIFRFPFFGVVTGGFGVSDSGISVISGDWGAGAGSISRGSLTEGATGLSYCAGAAVI